MKLSGFRRSPDSFKVRLSYEKKSIYEFSILLGQHRAIPSKNVDIRWLSTALDAEFSISNGSALANRFPSIKDFEERGLTSPFSAQITKAISQVKESSGIDDCDLEIFLASLLTSVEQLGRRAVVLELNILALRGALQGANESQKYRDFVEGFNSPDRRIAFFQSYPVLFRIVVTKLNLWSDSLIEFIFRLQADRELLSSEFGICPGARLKSVSPSGDTHNSGRSVMVIEFSDGKRLVYKPRSTSLESGFQKYIAFFNEAKSDLCLRRIIVLDKGAYGWVEYVSFVDLKNEDESDKYHYKLGFLTSIVYSLSGVDIFFENLICSEDGPVVIDLETMFHTPIDDIYQKSPVKALQFHLHESVSGIGVLPQPIRGATETELFDISVMGAKKNAKAPYKVTGIENFGRADMRITEIPGWIPETNSTSENSFDYKRKAQSFYDGLQVGLNSILKYQNVLASSGGVIDQCFALSKRRLIVRDTKVYGTLQKDETHPDLLRNQIDREWHWDNLWAEHIERPTLSLFCQSELKQLKQGDIPYFDGEIASFIVTGGDGSVIDLSQIFSQTPLQKVKAKLLSLDRKCIAEQARIAATTLGLDNLVGVTEPVFNPNVGLMENSSIIASYITSRVKSVNKLSWCDTSLNPVPEAKGLDPVRVLPSDPFLYDGIAGVAMYLHDLWQLSRDKKVLENSLRLAYSVFRELEENQNYPASGFVGLSSVVYAVNRCIEKTDSPFSIYDTELLPLMVKIAEASAKEKRIDFLLGTSGIASALLPYVKRTSNPIGIMILEDSLKKLRDAGARLLEADGPIDGMDYIRGLSHGISGVALTLYRLGEFFSEIEVISLAESLALHEHSLVGQDQWTDSHEHNGLPLVGWCHGSAGISLALSSMPKVVSRNRELRGYLDAAISNTLLSGIYKSKCLCHGTAGNLLCIAACELGSREVSEHMEKFEKDLLMSGFSSFGAAQSMGIGLMTGLAGAGYYLLGRSEPRGDFGFLTLA